jgi:hypothetical protein
MNRQNLVNMILMDVVENSHNEILHSVSLHLEQHFILFYMTERKK